MAQDHEQSAWPEKMASAQTDEPKGSKTEGERRSLKNALVRLPSGSIVFIIEESEEESDFQRDSQQVGSIMKQDQVQQE